MGPPLRENLKIFCEDFQNILIWNFVVIKGKGEFLQLWFGSVFLR